MSNAMHSSTKIFIVDTFEFIIIGEVDSIRIGNAIIKGIQHTSLMIVHIASTYNNQKNYILTKKPQKPIRDGYANDAIVDKNLTNSSVQNDIIEIDYLPENIKKLRQIFLNRKFGLEYLDKWCLRYTSKSNIFFNQGTVIQYIEKLLKESNPETESFSEGILDYANIMDTTPLDAYRKLKLDYDSISIWSFKINAIWLKYSDRINQLNDTSQMITLVDKILHAEMYASDRYKS
jgi:hypothetical protein